MTTLLLLALAISATTMAIVWLISVRIRNAGIVDIAWSALFAVIAATFAIAADGAPLRRALIASMTILWSVRLASHLARRILGHIDVEDGRYAELRRSWGPAANAKMFWFFQFQGATNVALSFPMLVASMNAAARLSIVEWIAAALWLVAITGETIADWQLRKFKADEANRGRVLDAGLWRFSRHPNYFFEWLVWCAYALFALSSPRGWIALYCPALMFWFLYKVTGIPATEEQSLRTKGEAYRKYQETTSAFFPWFSKNERESK